MGSFALKYCTFCMVDKGNKKGILSLICGVEYSILTNQCIMIYTVLSVHTPFKTKILPFHTPFETKFLPFHTPTVNVKLKNPPPQHQERRSPLPDLSASPQIKRNLCMFDHQNGCPFSANTAHLVSTAGASPPVVAQGRPGAGQRLLRHVSAKSGELRRHTHHGPLRVRMLRPRVARTDELYALSRLPRPF